MPVEKFSSEVKPQRRDIFNAKIVRKYINVLITRRIKNNIEFELNGGKTIKSRSLVNCKQQYPYCVMDFDHARGKKEFNISTFAARNCSFDKILEEIKKRDLVCANCHRNRTFKRRRGSLG